MQLTQFLSAALVHMGMRYWPGSHGSQSKAYATLMIKSKRHMAHDSLFFYTKCLSKSSHSTVPCRRLLMVLMTSRTLSSPTR